MQSYIIIGPQEQHKDSLETLLNTHHIDPIDVHTYVKEGSIGIEDIRNLQTTLFLHPVKSQKKAIILQNAQTLTIEAQNALLKVLEEPPSSTIFILTTTQKTHLLGTILSRCTTITIQAEQKILTQEEVAMFASAIQILEAGSFPDLFSLAQRVTKTKEDALCWLETMIRAARERLITDTKSGKIWDRQQRFFYLFLEQLQEIHATIYKTNVSARLSIEILFLNLMEEKKQ